MIGFFILSVGFITATIIFYCVNLVFDYLDFKSSLIDIWFVFGFDESKKFSLVNLVLKREKPDSVTPITKSGGTYYRKRDAPAVRCERRRNGRSSLDASGSCAVSAALPNSNDRARRHKDRTISFAGQPGRRESIWFCGRENGQIIWRPGFIADQSIAEKTFDRLRVDGSADRRIRLGDSWCAPE